MRKLQLKELNRGDIFKVKLSGFFGNDYAYLTVSKQSENEMEQRTWVYNHKTGNHLSLPNYREVEVVDTIPKEFLAKCKRSGE